MVKKEHVKISSEIVITDLIHSPDDKGYYFERYVVKQGDVQVFQSRDVYATPLEAEIALEKGQVIWQES